MKLKAFEKSIFLLKPGEYFQVGKSILVGSPPKGDGTTLFFKMKFADPPYMFTKFEELWEIGGLPLTDEQWVKAVTQEAVAAYRRHCVLQAQSRLKPPVRTNYRRSLRKKAKKCSRMSSLAS